MAKRKDLEEGVPDEGRLDESSSAESSSEDDTDMLDVEFEWFDPQPEHDFHGLKTLLRQLLDVDGQLFDLSALAELILAQPLLGSTVKVDGNETDPYAFLTVLNLQEHQEKPCVGNLVQYLLQRCATNVELSPLKSLLESLSTARIGLVLTERLINIPSEVVPPMYKMLLEEISWAVEENEPYNFSHYLILSKTYQEMESQIDQDASKSHKKKKQRLGAGKQVSPAVFYFHPEDEVLQRYAQLYGGFDYVNQQGEGQSDSKRAFQELGIRPKGHMILIAAENFDPAVKATEQYFAQG